MTARADALPVPHGVHSIQEHRLQRFTLLLSFALASADKKRYFFRHNNDGTKKTVFRFIDEHNFCGFQHWHDDRWNDNQNLAAHLVKGEVGHEEITADQAQAAGADTGAPTPGSDQQVTAGHLNTADPNHQGPHELSLTGRGTTAQGECSCGWTVNPKYVNPAGRTDYVREAFEQHVNPRQQAGTFDEYRRQNPKAADLHDEPEPALPATDGAEEPGNLDWLMGDSQPHGDDRIAVMAASFLRVGMKAFSPEERASIISEGEGTFAANLGRLDIKGTHYEGLDFMTEQDDEDDGWLM